MTTQLMTFNPNINAQEIKLPSTLKGLTSEIHKCLEGIAASSIKSGLLLQAAKEFHPDFNSWLDWSKREFGLGKAQACKLVKIAEVFGSDLRFQGASMRTLYSLSTCNDADLIEQAAQLSEQGELTPAWVAEHIEAKRNKPATEQSASAEQGEGRQEGESTGSTDSKSEAPFIVDGECTTVPDSDKRASTEQSASTEQGQSIAELVRELSDLRVMLARAQSELAQRDSEAAKAKAAPTTSALPTLPHLRSHNPMIVLGIEEITQSNVNRAARELVKLFKGNDEAIALIKAAKEIALD